MENVNVTIPKPQLLFGRIIYWFTVATCVICIVAPLVSMIWPERNVLNPYYTFASIFEGKVPRDVWQASGAGFPGGNFYLKHLLTGDGLAQLGIALIGCSSVAWALLAVAFVYWREKDRLFAGMCVFISVLVLLAMSGLIALGE